MPVPKIQVIGAGPAGLAAAITLARNRCDVVVHEASGEVGHRFGGDLQGLENWTSRQDVLSELQALGFNTDFDYLPCCSGTAYDAWGRFYRMRCDKPIFYLIERGPGPSALDTALLRQALELGVEVRFNSRVEHVDFPAILATGPKAADAIAVGYHFKTSSKNGFWIICDNNLAPKGYAYLLIMNGRGTVKSCMFSGFKHEKVYVERTVSRFRELVKFDMIDSQPHGGVGNFQLPVSALVNDRPVAGEQAGLQDTLWGFGIRIAIQSGILAARALIENTNYDSLWRRTFKAPMQASAVNRALYARLGSYGMRLFLKYLASRSDVRACLRHHYQFSWSKYLLQPWATTQYDSRREGSRP